MGVLWGGGGAEGVLLILGEPTQTFFIAKWHLKSILRFKDFYAFTMPKK